MGFFQRRRATRLLMVMVSHAAYAEAFSAEEAESLIAQGANVNVLMPGGNSPLANTSIWGNLGVAKVLLRHGADPNGDMFKKCIPLHIAALNGYVELIKLLVEHGANINAKDEFGETALHKAVRPDKARRTRTPETLVQLGADPNLRNDFGRTPFAEFQRDAQTLIGHPPIGNETQADKYQTDRELTDDLRRLSLLFGGC